MNYKLKNFDLPVNVTQIANIHYFEFTKQYHTKYDSHNFCELIYVDNGEIIVNAEHYSGILPGNHIIIHCPDESHSLSCADNSPNIIIIGFRCECEALKPFSQKPFKLSAEQKKMLAEILREGMSVYAPPYDTPNLLEMEKRAEYPFGADQMIKLRLEQFLINLIRESQLPSSLNNSEPASETALADIKRYIDEHYTDNIQLDNICFIFGTNKTTLCRNFKTVYGITILNYINSLKLKEAKKLLREKNLSVTQISEKLGFTSIHYFCRFFKKETGESPIEYSKTIRSKLNM